MYQPNFQSRVLSKKKTKKSKFTKEEDEKLCSLVKKYGENEWSLISKQMNNRNPRQVRERWKNYLDPRINNEKWTEDEDSQLLKNFKEFGPHWKKISLFFKNRSPNSVRNRFLKVANCKKLSEQRDFNMNFYPFYQYQTFSNNSINSIKNKRSSGIKNQDLFIFNSSNSYKTDDKNNSLQSISNLSRKIDKNENNCLYNLIVQPEIQNEEIPDTFWNDDNNDDIDFIFSSID